MAQCASHPHSSTASARFFWLSAYGHREEMASRSRDAGARRKGSRAGEQERCESVRGRWSGARARAMVHAPRRVRGSHVWGSLVCGVCPLPGSTVLPWTSLVIFLASFIPCPTSHPYVNCNIHSPLALPSPAPPLPNPRRRQSTHPPRLTLLSLLFPLLFRPPRVQACAPTTTYRQGHGLHFEIDVMMRASVG